MKIRSAQVLVLATVIAAFVGAAVMHAAEHADTKDTAKSAESSSTTALKSGVGRANFDLSVKPGDDFFQYVNGNWNKLNPIPPEYTRWGSFSKLHDDNLIALRKIVEDLATQTKPLDDNRRKIRDFYATAMDQAELNKLGAAPLD